jgi:hypothetical protein
MLNRLCRVVCRPCSCVRHSGKIGTETLIQMTRDMAAGCDHLSAHGIVHRVRFRPSLSLSLSLSQSFCSFIGNRLQDLAARNLLLEIKRNGEHHVKVRAAALTRTGLIPCHLC